MFLVLWIGSLVGSGFLWLYSQVTRVEPIKAGQLAVTLHELAQRARKAEDPEALDNIEGEVDRLLTMTIDGLNDGSVSEDNFEAFSMTFDLARSAITDRREQLAEEAA